MLWIWIVWVDLIVEVIIVIFIYLNELFVFFFRYDDENKNLYILYFIIYYFKNIIN